MDDSSAPGAPARPALPRELLDRVIQRTWLAVRRGRSPMLATYRPQLHSRHLRYADAASRVDYLHSLGASHLHASPHPLCRAESDHGYDVIDHHTTRSDLGTEAELEGLHAALAARYVDAGGLAPRSSSRSRTGSWFPCWAITTLSRGTLRDVFTGRVQPVAGSGAELPAGAVLGVLRVAMLEWDLY